MADLLPFDSIRAQHTERLRRVKEAAVSPEQVAEIQKFVESARLSGREIADEDDREYVRSLLTFWGNWLYNQTRTYPNTNLEPPAPEAIATHGKQIAQKIIKGEAVGESQRNRLLIGGGILLTLITLGALAFVSSLTLGLDALQPTQESQGVAETALAVNATTIVGVATDIAAEEPTPTAESSVPAGTPTQTPESTATPIVLPTETPTELPTPATLSPTTFDTTATAVSVEPTPTETQEGGGGGGFGPPPVGILSVQIIEPQTGALIRAGDQFAISATFFNMQLDWRLFIVLTRLESNEGVILPESMTITEDGATGVMTVEAALATPGTYSVGVYIATSKKEVQRLQRWAESNEPVTADTEYDGVILFRDLAVFGVE